MRRLLSQVFWLVLALNARAGFIYENADEFYGQADLDGDGRMDAVIVDKAGGVYRIGYQFKPGVFSWIEPRASGMESVTGFALGPWLSPSKNSLAFASPAANRVNLLEGNPGTAAAPRAVYPSEIGPGVVVGIDLSGKNNEIARDLLVESLWGGPSRNSWSGLRNGVLGFTNIVLDEIGVPIGPRAHANLLKLNDTTPEFPAVLEDVNRTVVFRVLSYTNDSLSSVIAKTGLPAGSDYAVGQFDASGFRQLMFYQPGKTTMEIYRVQAPLGRLELSSAFPFDFGKAVRQIFTLPGSKETTLLVLFGKGDAASIYHYDGVNAPALLDSFKPDSGFFKGAVPVENGDFLLLSGTEGRSTVAQRYGWNGSRYIADAAMALPPVTDRSGGANVFLFKEEPFVSSSPQLVQTLHAGDWTSALSLEGTPKRALVRAESFGDSGRGLGSPSSLDLGLVAAAARYGLANQHTNAISVFSLAKPIGEEILELEISPSPGLYRSAIEVSIASSDPAARIYYRTSASQPWSLFTRPFFLFENSTVSFYGQPKTGIARSTIREAIYRFPSGPGTLDSDGDGVPDFVEIAKGLNPVESGNDADGDGIFDLEEILAGTDPANPNSFPPAANQHLEPNAAFDLLVTPRPWSGLVNTQTLAAIGVPLRVSDLRGSLLGYSTVSNVITPRIVQASALLTNIPFDSSQRLLAAFTEAHFRLNSAGTKEPSGRELLRLMPVPQPHSTFAVTYNYAGANVTNEANGWIAAARAARTNLGRELVIGEMEVYDTLVALAFEKKIADLLLARGWSPASNITLFPSRPNDLARTNPPHAVLLSLESFQPGQPAHRLKTIYETLDGLVRTSRVSAISDLKKLTREAYRLSSASNQITGNVLPADALRQFLWTGALPAEYVAAAITAPELDNARNGSAQLLSQVPARPTTNLVLQVRADSFSPDCTILDRNSAAVALIDANAGPWRFPPSFNLVSGSRVAVFGFTDLPAQPCATSVVQVISATVGEIPGAHSDSDLNGNLLLDGWEQALLGTFAADAFADSDADGRQNLQELLDGTDPLDRTASGASPAAFRWPNLGVELLPGRRARLSWSWPAVYTGQVQFTLLAAPRVDAEFVPEALSPSMVSPGNFEVLIDLSPVSARFFQVSTTLLDF